MTLRNCATRLSETLVSEMCFWKVAQLCLGTVCLFTAAEEVACAIDSITDTTASAGLIFEASDADDFTSEFTPTEFAFEGSTRATPESPDDSATKITPPDQVTQKPVAPKPPAPKPAKKKLPPAFPGPKNLPPTGPYKVNFFENDFSARGKPGTDYVFGEEYKLMKFEMLDTNFVFSSGGEFRYRYMNQNNRLQPGGPGKDTYDLTRWRHYFDLKAGENFRFYVEGIDAGCFGEDLPLQGTDQNRWDLQNYFMDVELFETGTGTHTVRVGRQELLFGRQRLVSPLDWANTRRNFEGINYIVKEKDYKLNVFCVNPVNSATGYRFVYIYDHIFDVANRNVFFSGAYYSYTGLENTNIDLYYLWIDAKIHDPIRADGNRHTVGSRYSQLIPQDDGRVWDLDAEGGYQFGSDNGKDVQAGFATGILGHTWKNAFWSPRISGLFYYGSGDLSQTDNQDNTFYTMFPLGHAYWALTDNLTGQNLLDYAIQVDVKPTTKTGLTSAYHFFDLASGQDRAYNVAGLPVGSPGNGTDLGQALDLYGYYAFNSNFDIQAGYSWFWYGEFINRTTPRNHATQFYIQTSFRY